MFLTAPYRRHIKGMPDLLNYGILCDDGVIANKDGSLTAGFVFRGVDISSSTIHDRNFLTTRISDLLVSFGTGWMIHVDAVRQKAPEYLSRDNSHFSHPVFAMIDEERFQYFSNESERYESSYFMFVTYMPPSKAKAKILDWMFEDSIEKKSHFSKTLEEFNRKIRDVKSRLESYISIRRLCAYKTTNEEGDTHWYCELLQKINLMVSGIDRPVRLPFTPIGIDSLIGAHEFWTGLSPKINSQYIAAISIDNFPDNSTPNILNNLDKLGFSYRWNTRFSFFDLFDAEKALEKERKAWKQKEKNWKDVLLKVPNPRINEDAASMVWQYEQALNLARSGSLKYGHYTASIIVMNEDREYLFSCCEQIQKLILHLGFGCRVETVNTVETFLGSLPADSLHNIRRPLVSTVNLADMLPMSSLWAGRLTNPCPFYPPNSPAIMQCSAEGAAPYRLNVHIDDLGHFLVLGPTGTGKSTLLATLAAQIDRYAGCKKFIFDKGHSAYAISQCGGAHFNICVDEDVTFAPLSHLRDDFAWCVNYIVQLLELQGVTLSSKRRNNIEKGLRQLADSDIEHINISEFMNIANDAEVIEALQFYTEGTAGNLLNSRSDSFQTGTLQVFEIETLMNRGNKELIPVLLYIFRQIERSLDGSPAYIFIDEAWIAFSHPIFKAMLVEWLKVLRKANCVVGMFTQSLTDATKSGILDVLIEACPTKIFLANPAADTSQIKPIYQAFGLNDRQIDIIKNAVRKRHYYITSPEGNRLFDLALGDLTLSFVGAGSKEDIARMKALVSEHGDDWYKYWLFERNVISAEDLASAA
ncbi:conjugal transfer protein TrbE [Shewanella sp. 4t3-1-2LB]|uniref:VirB4 family type IV secretion/conjugal transfer ATPase n=1 Tax=Shewanella sp. 4t3-1-2LB TaxID=2817682 RepID=UPI001A97D3F2|nr:conjugal transfer protein TrbE [Shewanella sp. 4t3-1-2LB]MBO1272898.1 conjugal transfer protein TrbE [Shewanella sp. 4t3-1-2LB]